MAQPMRILLANDLNQATYHSYLLHYLANHP